jgi:hypothetical protein
MTEESGTNSLTPNTLSYDHQEYLDETSQVNRSISIQQNNTGVVNLGGFHE